MSLNYIKDPASQVPTLSAGGSGVDSIVRYYQNGTDEVKNLLKNECCMIYECSYCRALFRSIINFIAHKRTICRSLQSNVQAEQLSEVIKNAKEGLTNDQQPQQQPENEEIGANGGGNNGNNNLVARRNVKNSRALRRFNPAGNIAKHIRPVNVHLEKANANIEVQTLPKVVRQVAKTTIIDGKQVVDQLPIGMSIKERIPENRVPLVIPRENSTRCGEMQLRRRRSVQLKKLANGGDGVKDSGNGDAELHELTVDEIAILERIPSAIPVDLVHLRCEDERCTTNGQSPFTMLAALAHHLAIQHQTEYNEEALLKKPAPHIICFLCDVPAFKKLEELQKHFNTVHTSVREQHIKSRFEKFSSDSSRRRDKEISTYRARSLSPFVVKNSDEEKSDENKIIIKTGRKRAVTNTKTKRGKYTKPTSKAILTQQEEIKQQLSATYALKGWIEAKKRMDRNGNIDETTNSSNDMETGEGTAPDIHLDDEPTCSKDILDEVETGSDSTQIGLIDEDEARKIDMLLNSKAPEDEEDAHASEASADRSNTSTPSPATSDLLLINRPHRSRRPNTRYDIYENVGIVGSGDKGRKQRSGTPKQKSDKTPVKQEPSSPEKVVKKTPTRGNFSAGKRRILSRGTAERRMRQKRLKIPDVTSNTDAVHHENTDLAKVKTTQAVTVPTTAAAALREFRDFVLPDSIKTDKSGSETPTEFSNGARGASVASTTKQQIDRSMLDEICGTDSNSANDEQSETPPVLTKEKQQFPSVITDRYKEELVLYTPRAKVLRETSRDRNKRLITSDKSSHRKQNLNELNEEADGELSVLGTSNAKEKIIKFSPVVSNTSGNRPLPPPKPKDLAQIPVYLTETQRDLFFKPLKPLFNKNVSSDGLCQCGECGDVRKNIKDGRRHMVSHIRVIRVRCSLCDAGAFFCSDMRVHLMYRYCEKLNLAPDEFVSPGTDVPCMDKEKADMLTQLVDPYNPGRIMYSTGKIVSWTNPRPYFPDPKIERNILGPVLPGYVSSPHTSPKKKAIRSAILSPKKSVSATQSKEMETKKQESDQKKEEHKHQEGDEALQQTHVEKDGEGEKGESVGGGGDANNCTTFPKDSNKDDHSYL
ncbi:hypothetical protein ACQ4LE_007941 [Meloidogyne hapla]|uniref:C2H2-type domain-containing protein n=1 Tax=Meloidogyne hapla TaxID=6305 RepID=A0A1I8BJI4_MELHA